MATRLQNLIDSAAKPKEVHERKVISKKNGHLQKCLATVDEAIKALEGRQMDAPHLRQHDEQLQDYKRELADVNLKLFSLDLIDTDDLVIQHAQLEGAWFDLSVQLKKMSEVHTPSPVMLAHPIGEAKGVKARCSHLQWKHSQLEKLLGAIHHLSA